MQGAAHALQLLVPTTLLRSPAPASIIYSYGLSADNDSSSVKHACSRVFVDKLSLNVLQLLCVYSHRQLPLLCFRQHEGVTSALLVGSQVIRHAPADAQAELWGPFVAAAWPWTMWHHHAIRSPPPPPPTTCHAAASAHPNHSLCHCCVHIC